MDDTFPARISEAETEAEATRFTAKAKALRVRGGSEKSSTVIDDSIALTAWQTASTVSPTYKVEALGETITFSPEDIDDFYYRATTDEKGRWLWSWTDDLDGSDDEDRQLNYLTALGAWYDDTPGGDDFTEWHAVVGLETGSANVPQAGTAEFEGYGRLLSYPVDGNTRTRSKFETYLIVDLGASTISGRLHDFEYWESEGGEYVPFEDNPDRAMLIRETTINGNGFSTVLAYDPASCSVESACSEDITDESNFEGKFFGPSAEEAGGTLDLGNFLSDDGQQQHTGAGIWFAKQ